MRDKAFQERLIRRYVQNQANEEELEAYFHLLQRGELDELLEKYMKDEEPGKIRSPRIRKLWKQLSVAAAILIFLVAGVSLFLRDRSQGPENVLINDVAPGGNKATLTLADGRTISLAEAASGELAGQLGVDVKSITSGQLVYDNSEESDIPGAPLNHTISTPRGGQYRVVLPDGSKVWLNAASSLTYPTSFAGLKERRLELKGEAYFEVAADKEKPFFVITGLQTVEVLGTHFNVDAYQENPVVRTTLLEGSIRLHSDNTGVTHMLSPGQQAINSGADFHITDIDPQIAIAWKNGKFVFNDESLERILMKVARWYDVAIEFQDDQAKGIRFWGTVSRFGNISRVLSKLEITGDVEFTMVRDTPLSQPKVIVRLKKSAVRGKTVSE